jgi:hypothetical protein
MYLSSRRYDSRARTWLLVGQASLLLSAGLFLADLRHHRVGKTNIPYHGLEVTVDPGAEATRLGLRWTP